MSKTTGAPTTKGFAGTNATNLKSDATSGAQTMASKALMQGQMPRVTKATLKKAVFNADARDEDVLDEAELQRADDALLPQSDAKPIQVAMLDESAAASAGMGEGDQASDGTPPSDPAPAADKDGGGGIGTLPLVLGGLALVGGGVAAAAGGGKKNSPPTVSATQAVTTAEDTKATITVSASDPDSDPLTYSNTTAGKGTVTASGNTFTYTPNKDFNGTDSFTVTANDGRGGVVTQTVNITVTPVNDQPVAAADSGKATEDGAALTGSVATNDSDVDGDALTFALTNGPIAGLTLNSNGSYSFDPGNAAYQSLAAGATKDVVANYSVSDGKGGTANSSLTITVTGVNDAPVVANAIADQAVAEDTAWSYVVPGNAFSDVDNATLSLSATLGDGSALPGWLSFNAATRTFSGTPPLNFNGALDLKVTASDGTANVSDTFRLTVTPVNDQPVAVGDSGKATEDGAALTGSVATNDSDVDGDSLSFALTNGPIAGLTLNADGSYSFDPGNAAYQSLAAGATKDVVANYSVSDGKGGTASSSLTITVTGVNDAPVAKNVVAAAQEDGKVSGNIVATDVDQGAVLTYALSAPAPGLTLNPNGSFAFDGANAAYQDIAAGKTRPVVANYTVSDGQGGTASATFTLNVAGVNDAPVVANAVADQAVAEDTAWSYVVPANAFSDVDGDALTLAATLGDGSALPGWLSFNVATRTFSGTPPLNFNGALDLKVTASDGTASVSDTFRLTVTPVNDNPVAVADAAKANEDGPALTGSVATNDGDVDGDSLSFVLANGPIAGLTLNSDGSYSFDPGNAAYQSLAAGATKDVVANYSVLDGKGGTATSSLTITVTGVNDAPVVANVIADQAVAEDTAWSYAVPANAFSDVDGDALTLSATLGDGSALPGWLSFNVATRTFSGTPPLNFNGALDLKVTASDGTASVSDTFRLAVTPVNDNPVAVADAAKANEDGPALTGSVATNDGDVDGDSLSFVLANGPIAGLTLNSDGSYSFDPGNAAYQLLAAGATKDVVANYSVSDGKGGTASSSLTITVTGVNDAPVITSPATVSVDENAASTTIVYRASATDADAGTTLTYSLDGPDAARLSIDKATGEVRLVASANYEEIQSLSFDVKVSDGLATAVQSVNLAINDLVDDLVIDGGDAQNVVTIDATGQLATDVLDVNYRFLEAIADENDVRLAGFGKNDVIQFDADLSNYNFVNNAGDLVITANAGGTVSRIVIEDALDPSLIILSSASAANAALNTALGTAGVQYLATTAFPSQTVSNDQGNGTNSFDAAGARFTFTENASQQSTVIISNFTSDDRILVTGAAPGDFNFEVVNVLGTPASDLVITYNSGSAVNSITLVDFFVQEPGPNILFSDPSVREALIEQFVGFNFFQFA